MLDSSEPSRGLHQGDPFSSYLFLFVADGLLKILNTTIQRGDMQELKVCRRASGISHILFANDSLLFVKANATQAMVVKEAVGTNDSP